MGEETKDKGASHTVSTTLCLADREDTAHHKRLRSVIYTDSPRGYLCQVPWSGTNCRVVSIQ